jgi:uncharacterized membrane protein
MNENILDTFNNKYEQYFKKRAIKKVEEKLILHSLKVEDIAMDDYEAMISEATIEIKNDYSTTAAQIGFSLLGLDLLLG